MGALRDYVEGRGLVKPHTLSDRLAAWHNSADGWFDGSVESVDARLARCASLLAEAQSKAADDDLLKVAAHLDTISELSEDRRALASLREDLLTGASARAVTTLPGSRLANLSADEHRWVELESARFLADNPDTDAQELAERAHRFAQVHTSTLSPPRSHAVTAAFAQRVAQRHRQAPRARTAAAAPVFAGYADSQLYL